MYDYRNNIKVILNKTEADDKSLANSLNAIKAIIAMADGGNVDKQRSKEKCQYSINCPTKCRFEAI